MKYITSALAYISKWEFHQEYSSISSICAAGNLTIRKNASEQQLKLPSQSQIRNVKTPVTLTYQAVFCFNWTAVTQKPRLQVDFHYVSTGGAAENELIILWHLCNNINKSTWATQSNITISGVSYWTIQNERITFCGALVCLQAHNCLSCSLTIGYILYLPKCICCNCTTNHLLTFGNNHFAKLRWTSK